MRRPMRWLRLQSGRLVMSLLIAPARALAYTATLWFVTLFVLGLWQLCLFSINLDITHLLGGLILLMFGALVYQLIFEPVCDVAEAERVALAAKERHHE